MRIIRISYNSFDVLVLAVDALNPVDVVAKVEAVEAPLLAQKCDEDAAGPVEALAKHLLDGVLVFADGDAVDELQRRPQAVELAALVDVDDPVGRGLALPDGVVQVALDAVENHLEDGEAAAQPLPREEVAFARYLRLLGVAQLFDVDDDL